MKTETIVLYGIIGWIVYDTWLKSKTAVNVPAITDPVGPVDPLGQACLTSDGKGGTYQRAWDGTLICVPDIF